MVASNESPTRSYNQPASKYENCRPQSDSSRQILVKGTKYEDKLAETMGITSGRDNFKNSDYETMDEHKLNSTGREVYLRSKEKYEDRSHELVQSTSGRRKIG